MAYVQSQPVTRVYDTRRQDGIFGALFTHFPCWPDGLHVLSHRGRSVGSGLPGQLRWHMVVAFLHTGLRAVPSVLLQGRACTPMNAIYIPVSLHRLEVATSSTPMRSDDICLRDPPENAFNG